MDFHLIMTLLSRSWSILAGGLTVLLLPLGLNAHQQGYYFTFASLLTLQMFFELGLGQIVVQMVSHEASHLQQQSDGCWSGPRVHLVRLGALLRLMHRWYTLAALAFVVLAGAAGGVFFSLQGDAPVAEWAGPWVVAVLATALTLWCSPRLAACEGLGQVGQVARLRLLQGVLGYGLLWLGLWAGWGLWCVAALPLVSGLATWLWLRHLAQLPQVALTASDADISWREDILPLQWRTATTWISWFFILNLFTPLTFSFWGAREAGRLGLALTVFSSITTVGMSWVNAKFPVMGGYIARGQRQALDQLFVQVLRRALLANSMASLAFLGLVWLGQHYQVIWVARLADWSVLFVLALITVINTAIFAMATYMRAHGQEPMLVLSVFMGAAVGLTSYLGIQHGVMVMMLLYLALNGLINLPWTVLLWRRTVRQEGKPRP